MVLAQAKIYPKLTEKCVNDSNKIFLQQGSYMVFLATPKTRVVGLAPSLVGEYG